MEVKKNQRENGEEEFSWKLPIEEIIAITLKSMEKYVSELQLSDIINQMPGEIKSFLNAKLKVE